MKIYLQAYTYMPVHAIAAAALSVGTGKGVRLLGAELTDRDAVAAFLDTCRGHLSSVLEFASFNFFWEDVPIFLLRELVRHRVGCSYAEQSLRFAVMDAARIERFPDTYAPSIEEGSGAHILFKDALVQQIATYQNLLALGVTVQDARTVLGVWVPTHITTAFTYRALRDILSLRQTSQAHPAWQDAVTQIKALMADVHPVLAEELRDVCALTGRCVWQSKLDRPCSACAARGMDPNHVHAWTKFHDGWYYCSCGERTQHAALS